MRPRMQAVVMPAEAGEFGDDIRRIFIELGRTFGLHSFTGECSPPIDVYENEEAIEISMDLPGVDASAVRIVARNNAVLIAGEKPSRRGRGDSSFHLVERGFGRFARTVRLTSACDAGKARVTLDQGELRVTLPKMIDRRGRPIEIAITRT